MSMNIIKRNGQREIANPGTNTDMFRIYNAFTELISNKDKDIMNECEKTLLVKDIIGLNEY